MQFIDHFVLVRTVQNLLLGINLRDFLYIPVPKLMSLNQSKLTEH